MTKGIAPGTLWCGYDDIATSYLSLGDDEELDRCCRVHDFCPDKIKAGRRRDGLENTDTVVTKGETRQENTNVKLF